MVTEKKKETAPEPEKKESAPGPEKEGVKGVLTLSCMLQELSFDFEKLKRSTTFWTLLTLGAMIGVTLIVHKLDHYTEALYDNQKELNGRIRDCETSVKALEQKGN